ncbi:hypothetical protein DNU06_02185 [Putridiphycobacter roseus]|uniref:OmpA-like domain-containing protein n=1 Tax=Putridiphycobacter roseus TaxID=2219161 RepID=A0A2W1N4Y9_9FLAO|nr:DUF5723 family protein [Putridiphycobacter roseus]PZE18660.1 hypothetical protein DNU06_02185 [Putridiphycobacter roseus]
MRSFVWFVCFFLIFTKGFSQQYVGYLQSNYAGVNAGSMNPAFIADNRFLVDVNIGSFAMTGFNDYAFFNPWKMPSGYLNTFTSSSNQAEAYRTDPSNFKIVSYDSTTYYRNTLGSGNIFEYNNPKKNSTNLSYNHEIAIFNFMICLEDEIAFSFGIKQRTFVNLDQVSYELLALSRTDLNFPSMWNLYWTDQNLKFSTNTWNEYTLGIASVVYDKEEHFFKSGLNIKFLQGKQAAYFKTDGLEYELINADSARSMQGEIHYGYTENLDNSSLLAGDVSDFFDFQNPLKGGGGFGFGLDVGVVYEWRPKWMTFVYSMDGRKNLQRPDLNKYRIRAALSVNDIGGIRYKKGKDALDFAFNNVQDLDFDNLKANSLGAFTQKVSALVAGNQANYTTEKSTFFMNLPTHVVGNVDYFIGKNFYLNASGLLAFAMKNNENNSRLYNSFTFSPRFDHKFFSLSVPLSVTQVYGARIGASMRLGPYIVLGTSNLKPFMSAKKDVRLNGADIYFALKVPIARRVLKDTDKDLVSDKLDLCIDTPGVWAFNGCPDSDNDGVQDAEDKCPDVPGIVAFSGCPDGDGDGIVDGEDDCPSIAGIAAFNGCPDTDSDGITDAEDDCPTIAGLAAFNGCPDTDSDGIKDADDLCPNAAGPIENNGCPDTDKDGLFDYLDDCPEEAGPKENKGCPWADTDKDGILDKDDKCPLNVGPAANDGCPYIDTDGDGILDKDDACVNVPGVITNFGCPEIQEEEKEILQTAFQNLQFETGKAVIKEVSFESLDKLGALLVKKPEWKLKITGHTDSQGKSQTNLILSKKRAEAVRDYLISKGIDADQRIIVAYFGEEKPIADNSTEEGRQKNRRVEMDVLFE